MTTQPTITAATITDTQIKALRREARTAGDEKMVAICTVALTPDLGAIADIDDAMWSELEAIGIYVARLDASDVARVECARVIADAQAQ